VEAWRNGLEDWLNVSEIPEIMILRLQQSNMINQRAKDLVKEKFPASSAVDVALETGG